MSEENDAKEGTENNEGTDTDAQNDTDKSTDTDKGANAEDQKGDTINRHKHEREVGKLDARIKELEAENAKLKDKSEDVAALTKRLDEMEAKAKAEKVEASLKAAGCHNIKAAVACLDDYDGDVQKLKEEAPYLFTSTDNSKSTGGSHKGTPDPEDERTKKMRELMGLDSGKEK